MTTPPITRSHRDISQALRHIAGVLDEALEKIAGHRVSFALIVAPDDWVSYVSNIENREDVAAAMRKLLANWEEGMPDIPAHERQ